MERSNTKSVKFKFKSNVEFAIIHISNNKESEFKDSINIICELYKKMIKKMRKIDYVLSLIVCLILKDK